MPNSRMRVGGSHIRKGFKNSQIRVDGASVLREVRVCSMNDPRQILISYGHSYRAAFWDCEGSVRYSKFKDTFWKPNLEPWQNLQMDFFLLPLTFRMHTQNHTPNVVQGGGWRMEPLPGVLICSGISKRFQLSGKPLIFLTRWGIFYGRWRCWRPVASPTMVPSWPPSWILSRIKNHVKIVRNSSFGGLCMENNTWISKLHYLYYMYFHPKMAWPPAIYDVISRNHSNWPSISLSLLSCVASIY